MIKGSCLAILILLIGSSMILTASSQEQVSQTVYVYEGGLNGTLLSGVQVAGQDAAGNSFDGMTNSSGVVVVSGQPGTWLFVFIKDGYKTLDLSYNVTETGSGAVYLVKSSQPSEQIAPSQTNSQLEAISKSTTADQTQLETNATPTPLVVTQPYQERERLNPTDDSMTLTASSSEQVSQTVYVYEGDLNGTLLSGVQVAGQDAAGNRFEGMTNSNGVVVVSGQPGTWLFVFMKDGYETLNLSYNVTKTGEGAVYLLRSDQPSEQIAPSQNDSQLEAISESNVSQNSDANETKTASAEFWLENGNSLYEQGRYDEAVVSYDRSLLLNPQLDAAWFNKGNALYMQGNYDKALFVFDRAIEINPQDANAWICRGLTLKKLDRTLDANAAFIRAKELGYTG
ncbi:MAG: tetratricopeptide repeat protein [Methanothrix sp.]|nr:tetratricopeptide repeat protein [Methanothrix sp.]